MRGVAKLLPFLTTFVSGQRQVGIIVTGGHNADSTAERSVELLDVKSQYDVRHCDLPDLPDNRNQHTQVTAFY